MSYLAEALRALNEEEFDISTAGLEDLTDFVDNTDAIAKLNAVDTEARKQSELADSYVGKVILQCSVCHELIYKDPEDVVVGEDGDLVNIGEECPICLSTDGYKIIGQVGEYGDPENSTTVTVDSEGNVFDESLSTKHISKSLTEGNKYIPSISFGTIDNVDKAGRVGDMCRVWYGNTEGGLGEALHEELKDEDRFNLTHILYNKIVPYIQAYIKKGMTIGDVELLLDEISLRLEEDDEISFVNDDFKEALHEELGYRDSMDLTHSLYQKILPLLQQYVEKGLTLDDVETILEDVAYRLEEDDEISFADDDNYYYDAFGRLRKKYDVDAAMAKFNSLKENIEHVNVETDTQVLDMGEDENGKVQVTTEPKADTLEPVDAGTEDQFQYNTEEEEEPSEEEVEEEDYEDVEPEEFDEESFDELGESYLKEAYDNVKSYKTTSVAMNDNNLIIEGLITFNTGSKKKTSFVFESYQKVNGKFKFLGENIQITPNKKSAFSLRTRLDNGKLVCEALRYNYKGCSGIVVNEGEDLSKRTNSLTHAIEPIISKLQGLNKSEVYDLVNKTIKDAHMEKVPGAQRLLDRVQKARSDYEAQSTVTNSYLAGGNDAVINLKKKYH